MSIEIEKSIRIKSINPEQSMAGAHFFNSSQFLLNKNYPVKGWQLIKENPIAQIFFYIENDIAISGYQSTFGSFDLAKEVSKNELQWFINNIINECKALGVKKIKIKNYPSYFNSAILIEKSLVKSGFTTNVTEVNQHIVVDNPSFYDVAKRNEVRRSDKCKTAGFRFEIATIDILPVIYKLIESTLLRKGNKVSMSFEELEKSIRNSYNRYVLFTLWNDEILVASTVSIKINESVLYNFYHANHQDYTLYSPLTYLLKNIYCYCLEHKFKILDLGISTVNGLLNEGLFHFKKSRGAITSDKKVFQFTI